MKPNWEKLVYNYSFIVSCSGSFGLFIFVLFKPNTGVGFGVGILTSLVLAGFILIARFIIGPMSLNKSPAWLSDLNSFETFVIKLTDYTFILLGGIATVVMLYYGSQLTYISALASGIEVALAMWTLVNSSSKTETNIVQLWSTRLVAMLLILYVLFQ